MYPFGPERSGELGRVDIVKAAFDVEEERGGLEVQALKETNFVGEGCGSIEGGEARKRTGLVGVEEAA